MGVINNITTEHVYIHTFRNPFLHCMEYSTANEFVIIALCYERAGLVVISFMYMYVFAVRKYHNQNRPHKTKFNIYCPY